LPRVLLQPRQNRIRVRTEIGTTRPVLPSRHADPIAAIFLGRGLHDKTAHLPGKKLIQFSVCKCVEIVAHGDISFRSGPAGLFDAPHVIAHLHPLWRGQRFPEIHAATVLVGVASAVDQHGYDGLGVRVHVGVAGRHLGGGLRHRVRSIWQRGSRPLCCRRRKRNRRSVRSGTRRT
jgi:hypothetical protein